MRLVEKIKEFDIPEGWEKKSFNDLFTFSGGLSASREQLGKEGVCYLHYGDIHTSSKNYIDVEKEYEYIPKIDIGEDNINESMLLNEGDVVFVDASEDYEGASKHIVIKNEGKTAFVAGLHTIVAKSKRESLNNDFKRYCFETTSVKKQFYFYATGIKVYGLSKTNIAKIEMVIPPLIEQKKISKILMIWDRDIELKEKLLIEKQKQKKWLLKNLLDPDNGVRLPGFDSRWETVKVGDLVSERIETGHNGLQLLAITSDRGVIRRTEVDKIDTSSEDKSKYKLILPNDIGYNTMRMWQGVSGLSIYEGIVSPAYTILKPKRSINMLFLSYYFKTSNTINKFLRFSQGLVDDTLNLKYSNLKSIRICIPKDLKEQTAIADVLSISDLEIKLRERELENSKQQKKALMQMLLPGIVRVEV